MQLNIASSGLNSRMSLASSADEGNDDDDFDDAISMVHGIAPGSISKRKHLIPGKHSHCDCCSGTSLLQEYTCIQWNLSIPTP